MSRLFGLYISLLSFFHLLIFFSFFLCIFCTLILFFFFFFFNDTAPTEIYTLPLHDALPISAQQIVDGGFRAGLRVDALDDARAVEAVAAVRRRQRPGHHYRARRHAPVQDRAAGAVVDAGALPDEDSHRDHRARFDHDAFDDLGACADEAIVLDDGGAGLQRLENPADTDPARQVHVATDLRARAHRRPGVDHGPGADPGADVDVARHQHDVGRAVGAAAHQRVRHDASAAGAQLLFGGGGVLQRHLVVEAGEPGIHQGVLAGAERQQHGLLQPFVDHPAAGARLGNPRPAAGWSTNG